MTDDNENTFNVIKDKVKTLDLMEAMSYLKTANYVYVLCSFLAILFIFVALVTPSLGSIIFAITLSYFLSKICVGIDLWKLVLKQHIVHLDK